jgi:Holliday junction DNA helicase RuvA
MIAFIDGTLETLEPTHAVINVAGVGYEARISLNTFTALKGQAKVRLLTHLHVREDIQMLYGFISAGEKYRFLDLIGISGVGPGTALTILSSLSPDDLQEAILSGDVRTIQQVKGIGAKTAQRIILELKDKMGKESPGLLAGGIVNSSPSAIREEAVAALTTLGINRATAEKSVQKIIKNSNKILSLEELIKQALKTD